MDYWVPGVKVASVRRLLGNALIMKGGKGRDNLICAVMSLTKARRGKKMNDAGKDNTHPYHLYCDSCIPLYYSMGKVSARPEPKLDTSAIQKLSCEAVR